MINKIRTLLDLEVKLEERKLENGTVVEADSFEKGRDIFIKTDDEKVAMPVGEYILESGELIVVEEEGVIADVREVSDEVPEKEEETSDLEESPAEKADWAKSYEELKNKVDNLEDAIADIKERLGEKEDFEKLEEEVKQQLSETPAAEAITHSPEGNFQKEAPFHFANKRPTSILDSVMEKITNN